jgi:hypothetical protein
MTSQTPTKTGIPLLIDSDVLNTVDFHVASTNWLSLIDTYIDDIAATYVWNYTQHTSDPLTDEFRFFRSMNEGVLPLRSNYRGGANSRAEQSDLAYLSKLDTLLEPHWVWVRTDTSLPETRQNETTLATEYHAYDISNRRDMWLQYEYDTKQVTLDKINNLSPIWGMENLEDSQEFLLYWMKKYRRAHDTVKGMYSQYLSAYNVPEADDWFATVSDSIGLLHRRIDFPDTTMIPTLDVDFELLGISPSVIDPVIHDKIDSDTDGLTKHLSTSTNSLFRKNRTPLIRAIASSANSHGEVGVNDWMHWGRMMVNYGHMEGHVNEVLGNVHNALGYISNAVNNQRVKNPSFEMVVEDSIVRVDILKNKHHTLTSILTSRSTNSDVFSPVTNIKDSS